MSVAAHRKLPHVLFAVLTSRATRRRAVIAAGSWCASAGASCLFFADEPSEGMAESPMMMLHWTVVSSSTPRGCCKQKRSGGGGGGFFCSPHRRKTLPAQYRYLPALRLARRATIVASGRAQWVVLLDDDSFVNVRRLRLLLAQYDARRAVMLGEFKHDRSYACGGGGAVLSRHALLRLDLDACIARSSKRCMQSDWMLGECVRAAAPVRAERQSRAAAVGRVQLDARHGCGSCAVQNCTGECALRLQAGCHFMQNAAAHAPWILATMRSNCTDGPSIVHGLDTTTLARARSESCS